MAGINRLGKAPPRPGSLRPPDPNRNRIMNMYSEGAENDADYQRMVQDIEDAQQSQVGWLFGRGAFDKADLLYLRDEEEKRRFKEEELRDRERLAFRQQRATAPASADQKEQKAGPSTSQSGAQGKRAGRSQQTSILSSVVKRKGAPSGAAGESGGAAAGQGPHDRRPPEGAASGAAKRPASPEQQQNDAQPGKRLKEGAKGAQGAGDAPRESPGGAGVGTAAGSGDESQEEEEGGLGLLGGYGSQSD